jgi:hypothetical protein
MRVCVCACVYNTHNHIHNTHTQHTHTHTHTHTHNTHLQPAVGNAGRQDTAAPAHLHLRGDGAAKERWEGKGEGPWCVPAPVASTVTAPVHLVVGGAVIAAVGLGVGEASAARW